MPHGSAYGAIYFFPSGELQMTKFLSLAALSVAMVTLAGVVAQPLSAG
jgi:hypothetical protein